MVPYRFIQTRGVSNLNIVFEGFAERIRKRGRDGTQGSSHILREHSSPICFLNPANRISRPAKALIYLIYSLELERLESGLRFLETPQYGARVNNGAIEQG